MRPDDPYSPEVRLRFANPVNALPLKGAYPVALSAAASMPGEICEIQFSAGIEHGRIAEIGFRALACPHVIAAADFLCSELRGLAVSAFATVWTNKLMAALSIPEEKTGRIFLLEDALTSLGEQYAAEHEMG